MENALLISDQFLHGSFTQPRICMLLQTVALSNQEHNGTDGGEIKSFQESEDKIECIRHHL